MVTLLVVTTVLVSLDLPPNVIFACVYLVTMASTVRMVSDLKVTKVSLIVIGLEISHYIFSQSEESKQPVICSLAVSRLYCLLSVFNDNAKLTRPNKAETAFHDCLIPG